MKTNVITNRRVNVGGMPGDRAETRLRQAGLALASAQLTAVAAEPARRRYWVPSEGRWVRLRVSAKGMKTIEKRGIDAVMAELRAKGVRC